MGAVARMTLAPAVLLQLARRRAGRCGPVTWMAGMQRGRGGHVDGAWGGSDRTWVRGRMWRRTHDRACRVADRSLRARADPGRDRDRGERKRADNRLQSGAINSPAT